MLLPRTGLLTAVIALTGCGAHSAFVGRTTVERAEGMLQAPHSNQVLVTKDALPAIYKSVYIGKIQAGKVFRGGHEKVYLELADKAREIGADIVVEVKFWTQTSRFARSTPHASGKAYKLQNPKAAGLSELKGKKY